MPTFNKEYLALVLLTNADLLEAAVSLLSKKGMTVDLGYDIIGFTEKLRIEAQFIRAIAEREGIPS